MLETFITDVDQRRKRFVVYDTDPGTDIDDRLATRNVTVEHRQLPPEGPEPFVTIYDDDEFVGAVRLDELSALLTPPVVRPGETEGLPESYRALFDVLEETLFTALDRRQLLGVSREIEDRAFRVGRGTLRVGFQSLSVFEAQAAVYRRLVTETELDVHVYGEPDSTPPAIEKVTYHEDVDGDLARYWCLAFDGGGDETQRCALLAQEQANGFVGFWTYDPALVSEILATLRAVA